MQNFIVIGWAYFKLEQSKFLSNFEFDQNNVSGTGARSQMEKLTHCSLMTQYGINDHDNHSFR